MDIVWNIIWCLVQLCSFPEENKKEIRLMGGIPLILSILYDKSLDLQLVENAENNNNCNSSGRSSTNKTLSSSENEETQAV